MASRSTYLHSVVGDNPKHNVEKIIRDHLWPIISKFIA